MSITQQLRFRQGVGIAFLLSVVIDTYFAIKLCTTNDKSVLNWFVIITTISCILLFIFIKTNKRS